MDQSHDEQLDELVRLAHQRNWSVALMAVGWLHLATFGLCYYLTVVRGYHDAPGYLCLWAAELSGMWLIFRICGGQRLPTSPVQPLEALIRRIWTAYFLLAFNLGSLNALRGNVMFEFFPAIASLASFAFLMMALLVNRRFFAAVLVMFVTGLLMAANLLHAYLVFALAWWLVLNGLGGVLWWKLRQPSARPSRGIREVTTNVGSSLQAPTV